jgi:hypothetical protein
MDVLETAISVVLGIWVPHLLVAWDERRLDATRRQRGWNAASHWSAVVAFSFLCVPIHFARTRRTLLGFALGLVVSAAGLSFVTLLLEGLEALAS